MLSNAHKIINQSIMIMACPIKVVMDRMGSLTASPPVLLPHVLDPVNHSHFHCRSLDMRHELCTQSLNSATMLQRQLKTYINSSPYKVLGHL